MVYSVQHVINVHSRRGERHDDTYNAGILNSHVIFIVASLNVCVDC